MATTEASTYVPKNTIELPHVVASIARMRVIAHKYQDMNVRTKVGYYDLVSGQMAGIHLSLYQALTQQYKLATIQYKEGVFPTPRLKGFIKYCRFGQEAIEHHHHREEIDFFPTLVSLSKDFEADAQQNIKQHEAFHSALHALGDYLKPLSADPSPYSPAKHLEILDTVVEDILVHLEEELDTLSHENLVNKGLKEDDIGVIWRKIEAAAKAEAPTEVLPFYFGHNETDWLPIPPPVRLGMKILFAGKHSDAWNFCPYSPYVFTSVEYPTSVPFYAGNKIDVTK